jgi:hypothetical protein
MPPKTASKYKAKFGVYIEKLKNPQSVGNILTHISQ